MSEKPDLIKLFGVKGMITSGEKSLTKETDIDLGEKTPFEITQDIKILVDMLNKHMSEGEIAEAIACVQAITIRNTAVFESIISITNMINDYMRDRSNDDDAA